MYWLILRHLQLISCWVRDVMLEEIAIVHIMNTRYCLQMYYTLIYFSIHQVQETHDSDNPEWFTYAIANETCTDPEAAFCNGPLNPDSKYK